MSFQIGDVVVPTVMALEIDQAYSSVGGRTKLRTLNGSQVIHSQWEKLRVEVSGRGWVPAGLDSLDPNVSHVLRCTSPRTITSPGTPAFPGGFTSYRTDTGYAPYYFAIMPDGGMQPIGAAWASVAGAYMYGLGYYPQLTVTIDPVQETGSLSSGNFGWSLICEEV